MYKRQAEIYDQVVLLNQHAKDHNGKGLTNIVYMGMGEPLLNYDNVLQSIYLITSPEGLNMSQKRITVSTSGTVSYTHLDVYKRQFLLRALTPFETQGI